MFFPGHQKSRFSTRDSEKLQSFQPSQALALPDFTRKSVSTDARGVAPFSTNSCSSPPGAMAHPSRRPVRSWCRPSLNFLTLPSTIGKIGSSVLLSDPFEPVSPLTEPPVLDRAPGAIFDGRPNDPPPDTGPSCLLVSETRFFCGHRATQEQERRGAARPRS